MPGAGKAGGKKDPALVVVDVQRDFCPGGALAVKGGDEIIGPTNVMIRAFEGRGLPVVFTRDWHPPDHISFVGRGGPWPPHCVQGTPGAEFHPGLEVPSDAIVIQKGTQADSEAYSGFEGTDLARRLEEGGSRELYVCGLATDYCVKNTVLDALRLGFRVNVVLDCIRGVDVHPSDSARALSDMVKAGAKEVNAEDAERELLRGRVAVSSSS